MDQKKLRIAYHETGHAVRALICRQKVTKVSIGEKNSPMGTDKHLGRKYIEPFEKTESVTINELTRRIWISLGGYASEFLFSNECKSMGGDDLTRAIKWVEMMLESEQFRNFVATLPKPAPSVLIMIENPLIRTFIDDQIEKSIKVLALERPAVQAIAEELYRKEELSGDEVRTLFNSFSSKT